MYNMTVKDLRKLLKGLPGDTIIVAASDPEANSYRPIVRGDLGFNFDEDSGDIGLAGLDDAMKLRLGLTEDDVMESGESCLLLWPGGL